MRSIPGLIIHPRRSWAVALLLATIGILIIGVWGQADHTPSSTDSLPDGADSTTVVELSDELPQQEGSAALVLFSSDDPIDKATLADLTTTFTALLPTDAPASGPPGLIVSDDGTAAYGVVPVTVEGATQIAEVVKDIRAEVGADLPEGITAQVTGPAAIQADLAAVFDGADLRLLLATAGVVALLLLITYRSPFLWIVPLAVVGLADQVAAVVATHTLAAFDIPWDESTVGILVGAGLRRRHGLRTAADLPLSR